MDFFQKTNLKVREGDNNDPFEDVKGIPPLYSKDNLD